MWLKIIKKDVNRRRSFTRIPFTRSEPRALTAKGISCWHLTPVLFLACPWLTEAASVPTSGLWRHCANDHWVMAHWPSPLVSQQHELRLDFSSHPPSAP